ncbi:MAG: class I SAM-dependent methyltransferase [Brevundimonas sp.]
MAAASFKKLAAKTADLALAPLALIFVPAIALIARLAEQTPITRGVLDRYGVAVVKHHYYNPVVFRSDLYKPLSQARALPGLDLNEAGQLALIDQFDFAQELEAFPQDDTGDGYFFNNNSFEAGDAEILYDMIRHFKPKRLIEIGSGHSTRIARAAILANGRETPGYACTHTCIEPYEMPWLADYGVELIRERVELVDDAVFQSLESGDILFIDSSHMIRPQGDVLHEFLYLLPKLKPGVLIHVHDIFTPHDYPESWVLGRRLYWNEQYLLEAFLTLNPDFEIIAAVNWLARNHRDRLTRATPHLIRKPAQEPGSFWMRRVKA